MEMIIPEGSRRITIGGDWIIVIAPSGKSYINKYQNQTSFEIPLDFAEFLFNVAKLFGGK